MLRQLLIDVRRWWNPGYDCNSRGVIDYLYANGYHDAARDVEALFRK